jgi:hypothetical protein
LGLFPFIHTQNNKLITIEENKTEELIVKYLEEEYGDPLETLWLDSRNKKKEHPFSRIILIILHHVAERKI